MNWTYLTKEDAPPGSLVSFFSQGSFSMNRLGVVMEWAANGGVVIKDLSGEVHRLRAPVYIHTLEEGPETAPTALLNASINTWGEERGREKFSREWGSFPWPEDIVPDPGDDEFEVDTERGDLHGNW